MMELLPEWAPNLHPMLVHFPIAILFLAALLDLADNFLSDRWRDRSKTTLLYGLGAASLIVVYYTGTLAADSVFMPAGAQPVLNTHSDLAWWTSWFFGLYFLARMLGHFFGLLDTKVWGRAAFLLALPGIFLLWQTGDRGARMVFGYGVGTGQLAEEVSGNETLPSDSLSAGGSAFDVRENGDWSWPLGPHSVGTLLGRFHWLEGSAAELRPELLEGGDNYMLRLQAGGSPNFFAGHESFRNVQVDYHIDLSDFQGRVSFVHHARDARNYDFAAVETEGSISLGRTTDGERTVFAEEPFQASGMLFIRVVGEGTHFRAYVNRELAVHGHGEAPEAGSVGLRLEGEGRVVLDRMALTQL